MGAHSNTKSTQIMTASYLVIGANRGIGLELTKQLAARQNVDVYAGCRKASSDLNQISGVKVVEGIDISNDSVIKTLKNCSILPEKLDGVICNSGVLKSTPYESLDNTQSLIDQFNVNSVGPVRVIKGLEDRLKDGSKYAIITSRSGSIGDNGSGGLYGYRMSKAAVNCAGKSLSLDLKPKGVAVGLLHPGFVVTDMTSGVADKSQMITAATSAAGLLARFDELEMSNTGTFWHMNGTVLPW